MLEKRFRVKNRTLKKAVQYFIKAASLGRPDLLGHWLSPEVMVEGFHHPVVVSNATGAARLLIWVYSLNQLVADLTVVCVRGFPHQPATATDLALQLSGTWRGAAGVYRPGEHFTTVIRISLEFRDGLFTKVTERH